VLLPNKNCNIPDYFVLRTWVGFISEW